MRLGLAAKLCLLAAVLVLTASGASFLFFENARAALRERELVELTEDMEDRGKLLMADFDRVHADLLRLAVSPATRQLFAPGRTPTDAERTAARTEAQQLFERRRAYQQCDFVRTEGAGTIVAEYARGAVLPDSHTAAGKTAYTDARRLAPGEIAYAKFGDSRRADVFAAIPVRGAGSEQTDGVILLRIDLAVWSERLNQSARMLGFLVNDTREYLAHPVRDKILTSIDGERSDGIDAMIAQAAGQATSPTAATEAIRNANLKLPDLAYVLATARLAQSPRPADLAKAIAETERLDPTLRISADSGPDQLLCRAATAEKLKTGIQELSQRLGIRITSDDPIPCSTFAATVKVLRPDAMPGDRSARWFVLGLAVANEEVERAILAAHRRNLWLTLALSGAAGLVALFFAHYLTRPLRQMIGYAERVADGQESEAELALPQSHAKDEIGRLARAFGSMVDQVRTRTRELRESEARIRTILNTAAEGIITIDERGNLESFNLAAERLFGFAAAEVRGRHFTKLLGRGEATDMPTLLGFTGGAARESGPYGIHSSLLSISRVNGTTREVVARKRNGATFPAEMSVSEVILGDRLVYTAILRDVTERKENEAASERMTIELERRVAERTTELIQANQALESARDLALEANRAKDAFLAVMSHELRTPLNAIIGYCDYWLQEADEPNAEEMVDDLRKMQVSGKHLLTLINDILDLAKIQAGKVTLELSDFAIESLLTELQEWVAPLVRKNNNTLSVDTESDIGMMHSDRTRVRQVLLNLLSNASKFTSSGRINMTVRRQRTATREDIVFAISDTGVGMKPDDLKRLFRESFFQADSSSTRKHEGTGLGLVICHKLVKLMGGDIDVQSKLGAGTTFTVRIAAQVNPALPGGASGSAAETPTMRWQPTTVLVVDDDPNSRMLFERVLRREGYVVRLSANGEEAVALARECAPSAIVLDALAPHKNGWSALAALKNDPATADLPIIMATIVDEQSRGLALGGTDFVAKPIDWDRLGVILRPFRQAHPTDPILVVEDDEPTRSLTVRHLAAQGWQVHEAVNGREALERVAATRPAVILLDLMMPEMNGFDFVEHLRRNESWRDIPVVVVTAMDLSPSDRARLSGSVQQILQKGVFTPEQLLSAVRERISQCVVPR